MNDTSGAPPPSRRSAWPWVLVALVVAAILLAGASSYRAVLGVYYEWRLDGATSEESVTAATRGILTYGGDGAIERLADLLAREQRSHKGLPMWFAVQGIDGQGRRNSRALALIPHLLAASAAATDDSARGFPLEVISSILRDVETDPVFIHVDGQIFFYQAGASGGGGISSSIDQHPPRIAVFAWADWLVSHGYVPPDDPVLRALGDRPVGTPHPRRLGLTFDYGAEVRALTPTGTAAAIGVRPGDVLRSIGDPTRSTARLIDSAEALREWVGELRRSGAATVRLELRRAGRDEKLTFALPASGDLGLETRRRLEVQLVIPDMPAARSGIVTGDVLRTIDGVPVGSSAEILALLGDKSAVEAGIERGGVARRVSIRLGARPGG